MNYKFIQRKFHQGDPTGVLLNNVNNLNSVLLSIGLIFYNENPQYNMWIYACKISLVMNKLIPPTLVTICFAFFACQWSPW